MSVQENKAERRKGGLWFAYGEIESEQGMEGGDNSLMGGKRKN